MDNTTLSNSEIVFVVAVMVIIAISYVSVIIYALNNTHYKDCDFVKKIKEKK